MEEGDKHAPICGNAPYLLFRLGVRSMEARPICARGRQTLHVVSSEEVPHEGHPDHDPNRGCGRGDLGYELARTSTVLAMYQRPWLRGRITAKLQCLLQ